MTRLTGHAAADGATDGDADTPRDLAVREQRNADGNAGRGRSSGQQKKLHGHPRLDPLRGEIGELECKHVVLRGHQVDERRAAVEAERCPVEVVVRDETEVVVAATAVELDAVDARILRAGQLLEAAEAREAHRGTPCLGHENR